MLVPGPVLVGARVGDPVHQRRGAHVLHPAEEVGDGGLRVLGPRVADAGELGVCPDHVGRHVEQAPRLAAVLAVDVVVHRDPLPGVVDLHQRRHDQRNEVRRGRLLLVPGHGALAAAHHVRDQPPVGDGDVLLRHSRHHLPRQLVAREVEGRKPIVVAVILALAPDLLRPVREAVTGDVREPAPVLHQAVVGDRKGERVAEGCGASGEDHQRVTAPAGAQRGAAAVGYGGVGKQRPLIQDERIEPGPERDERSGHAPLERQGVPVEGRHGDPLVDQVVVVRARVVVVRHQGGVRLSECRAGGRGEQERKERDPHRRVLVGRKPGTGGDCVRRRNRLECRTNSTLLSLSCFGFRAAPAFASLIGAGLSPPACRVVTPRRRRSWPACDLPGAGGL